MYVRSLDALVVLDRMESNSTSDKKTFLLHFPNAPTVSGNTVVGLNGSQSLKLTTLTPAGQTASQPFSRLNWPCAIRCGYGSFSAP